MGAKGEKGREGNKGKKMMGVQMGRWPPTPTLVITHRSVISHQSSLITHPSEDENCHKNRREQEASRIANRLVGEREDERRQEDVGVEAPRGGVQRKFKVAA